MADPDKIVAECASGDFFVDTTCINCDTCRQLAPSVFADQGDFSFVKKQPASDIEVQEANQALLCCPTGSIGTIKSRIAKNYMDDFPLLLEEEEEEEEEESSHDEFSGSGLYYCGFNSRKSYGANSYFLKHKDGNWLIDSPRYVPHLAKSFARLGGVKYIFLTHRDDVADSDRYAQEFQAKRIIHKDDKESAPGAEIIIEGQISLGADFKIIPVPGHTKGHMVLLVRNRYLFTGDHLAYNPGSDELIAFRDACWYSFEEQRHSMTKLLAYDFEWVLPGHGNRVHKERKELKNKLSKLIEAMK